MSINFDDLYLWKQDIIQSVDMYRIEVYVKL